MGDAGSLRQVKAVGDEFLIKQRVDTGRKPGAASDVDAHAEDPAGDAREVLLAGAR